MFAKRLPPTGKGDGRVKQLGFVVTTRRWGLQREGRTLYESTGRGARGTGPGSQTGLGIPEGLLEEVSHDPKGGRERPQSRALGVTSRPRIPLQAVTHPAPPAHVPSAD